MIENKSDEILNDLIRKSDQRFYKLKKKRFFRAIDPILLAFVIFIVIYLVLIKQ